MPDDKTNGKNDHRFEYMMLDRLRSDCEYFLGAGQRYEGHLWAGNVREHIAKMRELYNVLPVKPEWLSQEDIDNYAERMEPPFSVVVYRSESGFDEMSEYQLQTDAEKAAQRYVDSASYEGAAVYNKRERVYSRIVGYYPDAGSVGTVKKRLFVDMDGTLAVFKPVDTLETLYSEGYFASLEPQQEVIDAIEELCSDDEFEVFVLSAYLSDSPYALSEKNEWLDKHLPNISPSHRLFVPCGEDKASVVPGGISEGDYLLDDYTLNLLSWDPPGHGIKLLNGINHTKGTWKKDKVRHDQNGEALAQKIRDIAFYGRNVRDSDARHDSSVR